MQMKKIGTPVAIAALLLSVGLGSAKADESITTTTTKTTTTNEPGMVATTEIPGSVVYFHTVPTTTLLTTIEGRRKDLEDSIDQARNRGDISDVQCAALKRELRRIAYETGSNTISYPAVVMIAEDLDLIGQQYRTVVTTAPVFVPIITGSTFTISAGKAVQLDDLSMRRIGLEARITKDLFQGRLSEVRANELRQQLANIGNEANLYTADGNFDPKESRRLYDAFDHVAQEIDKSAGKDNNPQ